MTSGSEDRITAEPTKRFFVEMFTKDIALEQAVLDLVDNSVDGARRSPKDGALPLDGYTVQITLSKETFRIDDNCGGFDKNTAREYAFRFGRDFETPEVQAQRTSGAIGQFGVGMKRALFKFGQRFKVYSATTTESWGIDVNVESWERAPGWTFDWAPFSPKGEVSQAKPGTEIEVSPLHASVGNTFGSKYFENQIIGLIKSKHRSFISKGLDVTVNGTRVQPLDLTLYSGQQIRPGIFSDKFDGEESEPEVRLKLVAGVGTSAPREAGWYVICNGRVVLEADTRNTTGWGEITEELSLPKYHGQFARFRGMAIFESDSSQRVPWNTTKTDIDADSAIWRAAREKMIELMRPVIDFLNELDADIEEHGRDRSPLLQALISTPLVKYENLPMTAEFEVPSIDGLPDVVPYTKIQYSRPVDDVAELKRILGVGSAKAVGERTFDNALRKARGE
ncbi:MAG: ATP-binding protein [Pseudomonadota bacterium]